MRNYLLIYFLFVHLSLHLCVTCDPWEKRHKLSSDNVVWHFGIEFNATLGNYVDKDGQVTRIHLLTSKWNCSSIISDFSADGWVFCLKVFINFLDIRLHQIMEIIVFEFLDFVLFLGLSEMFGFWWQLYLLVAEINCWLTRLKRVQKVIIVDINVW